MIINNAGDVSAIPQLDKFVPKRKNCSIAAYFVVLVFEKPPAKWKVSKEIRTMSINIRNSNQNINNKSYRCRHRERAINRLAYYLRCGKFNSKVARSRQLVCGEKRADTSGARLAD